MVLSNGNVKIGVYHVPGKPRPRLCKEENGELFTYACFTDQACAEEFMAELCKFFGVTTERKGIK